MTLVFDRHPVPPGAPSAAARALQVGEHALFALLLHCRTKAVSDCRFGYLQAQPPVYEAGKMIMGAFVLLAPDTGDPIPVEVMRMVSAQLIEEPELIERLRGAGLEVRLVQ